MNFYHEQQVIHKIAKTFSNVPLVRASRIFICHRNVDMIQGANSILVNVQFFNDFILVHRSNQLIQTLQLSKASFVKYLPNFKYFKHVFIIYGIDGFLIFSSPDRKEIISKLAIIGNFEEQTYKIEANKCVQRIDKSQRSLYQAYQLEIKINEWTQNVFARFSLLEKIEKSCQKNSIFYPKLFLSNFDKSETKFIESRQLFIQALYQYLLSFQPELPSQIIEIMQIDFKFYKQELIQEAKSSIIFPNQNLIHSIQTIKPIPSQAFENCHQKLVVKLPLIFPDELIFSVTEQMKIRDVFQKIQKVLGFTSLDDMALFVAFDDITYALDNDEYIKDVKEFMAKKRSMIFTNLIQKPIELYLHKVIHLPLKLEIKEYNINPNKLKFTIFYILKLIKDEIIIITKQKLCFIASFFIQAELDKLCSQDKSLMISYFQKICPSDLFKSQSEEEWLQQIRACIKQPSIVYQLDMQENIIQKKIKIKNNSITIQISQIQQTQMYLNLLHDLQQELLSTSRFFNVTLYRKNPNYLTKLPKKLRLHIGLLGVSFWAEKAKVHHIPFEDLLGVTTHPFSILFHTKSHKIRVESEWSWSIDQCLELHQKLWNILLKSN